MTCIGFFIQTKDSVYMRRETPTFKKVWSLARIIRDVNATYGRVDQDGKSYVVTCSKDVNMTEVMLAFGIRNVTLRRI